jgi:uncharacterized protein (DUF427 family)
VLGALVWVLLAWWRPETTWHLAPALVAAAGPWVLGQDTRRGDRAAVPWLVVAAVGGVVVSVLVTWGLSAAGLLVGPTVWGFAGPALEHVVLGGTAGLLALLLGVARVWRARLGWWSAWHGSTRVAGSDDVVLVEGNAYFPAAAIRPGTLSPGCTRTVCPWKGVARYYTLTLDGVEIRDAAWAYAHPLPPARRIKGRFAFAAVVAVRAGKPPAGAEPPAAHRG